MKKRKTIIAFLLLLLLLVPVIIPLSPIEAQDGSTYIIDGDRVYIDDSRVYISVYPHTSSGGWIYGNVTSKVYSGEIDFALGFDRDVSKPTQMDVWSTREDSWKVPDRYFDNNTYYKYNVSDSVLYLWNKIDRDLNGTETVLDDWKLSGAHPYDRASLALRTIYWDVQYWKKISKDIFGSVNFDYGGMDRWYYATFNVQANVEYYFRVWLDVVPSRSGGEFKYWVVFKRSSDTWVEARQSGRLYALDPWYNTDWSYRKSHTITGTVDGIMAPYQVGIKVYYGSGTDGTETIGGTIFGKFYTTSKCQTDFDDIRFTKLDGNTLLDYWLEDKTDSSHAIFWVEIDSIPASPSTVDIYVYYGNAGASTASSGTNTFPLFDHFDDESIDTDIWIILGTPTESGTSVVTNADEEAIISKVTFDNGALRTLFTYPSEAADNSYHVYGFVNKTSGGTKPGEQTNTWDGDIKHASADVSDYEITSVYVSAYFGAAFTRDIMWIDDTSAKFYINETLQVTHTTYVDDTTEPVKFYNYATTASFTIDWVFVRNFTATEPTHTSWGSEEGAPTITSATITDMDDTDNMYAMLQYYTFRVVVDSIQGADTIANVSLRILDGTTVMGEFLAATLDGVPAYSIVYNATEFNLDAGGCSWNEDGNEGTAVFKIAAEWDVTQTANLELNVTSTDTVGGSSGWTEKQANYFDIITRLVTINFAANATYVERGTGVELTGSVRYATTVGGNTASTLCPPDAQFTDVAVHNTTHNEQATDTTIVNGAFSIEFTIPDVVQANVYHVYLDLVADYTDADAPDGDTVTVYGVGATLLFSFDDETGTTTAFDSSDEGNDGTISGSTRTGEGYFGKAMVFDGINDYINVTDDASLDIVATITMSAWIYTPDPNTMVIIEKKGAYKLSVEPSYGIRVTINTTHVDTAINIFNASEWTRVTGMYNGTHVNIFINAVLVKSGGMTGSIASNANDLFIGNQTNSFNGTMDEVTVHAHSMTQSNVQDYMNAPIATFPYNLQGIINDMEATNWVFAQDAYEYQGIYVRQNASYLLDTVSLRFTDGVAYTTVIFDIVEDDWEISSAAAYLVVHENSSSGNEWTVTWEIYLTENIFDALDVDISMYCNDTSARSDSWEVVEEDYFNIYNHGGMPEYDSSVDGFSVAGEGVFGLAVQNFSAPGGAWAYANITWRKLQHVNFLVHWWSNTTWDAVNLHFDCPSEHNNTGYVEYGINYWYDGSWLEGWKVRLEIEDGAADANDAWVLVNATWYNRGLYVTHEEFYAYYEAYTSTDTSRQFALVVDLWVGIEGGSSTVCGRVGPEYFGINKTTGIWADWRPVTGLEDESVFFASLLDDSLAVFSAEELEMFTAWANFTKTSNQTGLGSPGCNTHLWGLLDYSGPYWRTLSPFEVMRGIIAPITVSAVMPGEVPTNFFSALITAMIEGITKPIVAALGGGAKTLSFIMSRLINSAFQFFIPGIDFGESIKTMLGTYGGYLVSSMVNMTTAVVQVFRIVTGVSGFLLTWLTRMITLFINIWTIAGEIWSGTSTAITGLTDMWGLMNIDAWIDAVPIFIAIGWLDSIDKRARRVGGGWMSFFIGDLQMVSWVLSFLVEWFTRIIEFVINRVMQFINILPI